MSLLVHFADIVVYGLAGWLIGRHVLSQKRSVYAVLVTALLAFALLIGLIGAVTGV